MIIIRPITEVDVDAVAAVHSEVFARQSASRKWVKCNFNAYPRIMMFVAEHGDGHIAGYIQWIQKSGFRKEAVIELEQIAVLPDFQGKGVGTKLINESLSNIKDYLKDQDSLLKSIIVTTRSDNQAQSLYKKVLNAEMAGTIKNLYSHDEVIMLAKCKE